MLRALVAFAPVAALLTLTPGAATALVVRSAATGGQRRALATTVGNSVGVLAWGCFAAMGIAAVVATSAEAFTAFKLVGAVVLVVLGLQSLRGHRADPARPPRPGRVLGAPLRDGLVTSFANPKLAVFFIALFPQFVPDGAPVLPVTLGMALLLIAIDLVYFSVLALVVSRARHAVVGSRLARRLERLTGAVMIGLGVRVALE